MSECEKIEKLLWEYPDLSPSDRDSLSAHLDRCPTCREELETLQTLGNSCQEDRRVISQLDSTSFDNAVLAKIRGRKRVAVSRTDDRRFLFSTLSSVGLAAAIVVFMIISISDLGNLPAFKQIQPSPEEEAFDYIEIRLKPVERFEAPKAMAMAGHDKKSSLEPFSILEKPVTAPSPDSVNIGVVYLSDETVPLLSQQTRASISEVIVDTGMIQAVRIPEAILVTVEKMPRAIDMVPPEYPVWGRKRELSSVVWVKARIDENGTVIDARIISSSTSGAGFEDAALEAALKSRYLPAESNGIRIPVWIMYPVKFIYKR